MREDAVLGENCVVGRGAYIGTGVQMGDNCKVQNYALVYEPAVLGDGVFIGPAVVLTNDTYPRAVNPDGSLKTAHDWEPVGVTIGDGASIGARAVCVAPVTHRRLGDGRRRRGRDPRRAGTTRSWPACPPAGSAGSARAGDPARASADGALVVPGHRRPYHDDIDGRLTEREDVT